MRLSASFRHAQGGAVGDECHFGRLYDDGDMTSRRAVRATEIRCIDVAVLTMAASCLRQKPEA